jgi:hypothetical protein
MSGLPVPRHVYQKTTLFLNSMQSEGGAMYGYDRPESGGSATTAVGLLCRMYLGWKRDNPALVRGAQILHDTGPVAGNMYYNYYATQVLHHFGGELWTSWNERMREMLVDSQVKEGHSGGSWGEDDIFGDLGGRLYYTSLATMTLEVYYRHMPLYAERSLEDGLDVPAE